MKWAEDKMKDNVYVILAPRICHHKARINFVKDYEYEKRKKKLISALYRTVINIKRAIYDIFPQ